MKKTLIIMLTLSLLLSLTACGKKEAGSQTETAPAATPLPTAPVIVTEELAPTEAPADDDDWAAVYRKFLLDSYASLSQGCYGFVAGLGYIDLDLDTVPELLVYDAGAGASMGVQIFDIADGSVVCVSASSTEVRELFGGSYTGAEFVSSTSLRDFRLREGADGSLYFEITSYNGAEDFRYTELVRFRRGGSTLTLESMALSQTSIDPETQSELYTVCTVGDTVITQEEYDRILGEAASAADLGYEAAGAFKWDDPEYDGAAGFLKMIDTAEAAYVPAL